MSAILARAVTHIRTHTGTPLIHMLSLYAGAQATALFQLPKYVASSNQLAIVHMNASCLFACLHAYGHCVHSFKCHRPQHLCACTTSRTRPLGVHPTGVRSLIPRIYMPRLASKHACGTHAPRPDIIYPESLSPLPRTFVGLR